MVEWNRLCVLLSGAGHMCCQVKPVAYVWLSGVAHTCGRVDVAACGEGDRRKKKEEEERWQSIGRERAASRSAGPMKENRQSTHRMRNPEKINIQLMFALV